MATIRLKLLETKRIAILNESNEEIFQGGNDELVIAGESNVTRITLDYDESIYGSYTFYADMINARGEGKQYLIGQSKNILLSDDMTYPGYTKIFISARKDEEIARWEKLNLRIWSTIPKYGNDPTKPNQPTVDIIPNIRFNASVDNNSGVPTVDVIKSGTLENPIFTLNFKNLRGSNLKPNGTATSTEILAFQEDKGIWVGTDTGYWYYWNGTRYSEGGAFQSVEIEDGAVTMPKLGNDVTELITEIRNKGIINESRSKENTLKIKTNQNHILFNSDRLDILEAQINADKNTIEYTSDKALEITCNGANIIDCNAHFKKVEGQTRRYSLNLLSDKKLGTSNCTYRDGVYSFSNVVNLELFRDSSIKGDITIGLILLKKPVKSTSFTFYNGNISDNNVGFANIQGFELNKTYTVNFNITKDFLTMVWGNENNEEVQFKMWIVKGAYTAETIPPFQPYDNTLVNSKATFVSTGRNLYSGVGNDGRIGFDIYNGTIPKGTYYLLFKARGLGHPYDIRVYYGDTFETLSPSNTTERNVCTIPVKEGATRIYFNSLNKDYQMSDIMLVAEKINHYEPYIKNISQYDIELGAYDYIENGNLIKQTSEVGVIDGKYLSDEVPSQAGAKTKLYRMYMSDRNVISNSIITNSKYGNANASIWVNDEPCIGLTDVGEILIRDTFQTPQELQEWLKTNHISYVYKKATPTITPIVVPNGIVSYKNGLTSQEIKGKYLPYKYTAKYVNGGAK